MIKDYEYYCKEFVEGLLEHDRGIWESLGRKYIRKQEKRYEKAVDKLRESEEGVQELAKLLDHESGSVALTAAVYLLKTFVEMKAVDTFRKYAKGSEDSLYTLAARLRLEEWEEQKSGSENDLQALTPEECADDNEILFPDDEMRPKMSKEEYAQALRLAGLSRYEDDLLALCLSSIIINCEPTKEELELGVSKVGGLPDMPLDIPWPKWGTDPLSFIAQFRMSDVAKYDIDNLLPTDGMMYFFYDAYQDAWGSDPADAGSCKVIYFNGDLTSIVRRKAPRNLPQEARFGNCRVSFSQEDSFPASESHDVFKLDMSIQEMSAYQNISQPLVEYFELHSTHRLLGNPDIVQDDMQVECQLATQGFHHDNDSGDNDPSPGVRAADWRLLLQIGTEERIGMMWGDSGRLYFWIPKDALATHDFDKVWTMLQCY